MKFFKINLFLMFLILISLSFESYAQDDLKEYFPLNDGNIWVYEIKEDNTVSIEKSKIDGKEYVNNKETIKMVYEDGRYDCIGRDSEGIKAYKEVDVDGSYLVFTPPFIILPFNKESPKKYKCSYLIYDNEGCLIPNSGGEITMEIKFEAREGITIPAGKFLNCIKVLKSESWDSDDGGFAEAKSIVWFAKGVGKVEEISEEIGYDAEEGSAYTDTEQCELKRAIVNSVEYGK